MKRLCSIISVLLCVSLLFCGCKNKENSENGLNDITEDYTKDLSVEADISAMDFDFSSRDLNASSDTVNTVIIFSANSAQITGSGAEFSKSNLTIRNEGVYSLSGNFTGGKIIVEAPDTAKIQIVFDNLSVENSSGNAVYIKSADKVFITLKEGTENSVSDGEAYTDTDGETNIDAALFSKADLTINGKGRLNVNGNAKHAVISKDDLSIVDATVNAVSKNVGLGGKDCVKIYNAVINITAGSDGIRSDNTEDAERGYIYIKSGTINITSENDALQASTVLKIDTVTLSAKTGGGSANASTKTDGSFNNNWGFGGRGGRGGMGDMQSSSNSSSTDTESAKALKAGNSVLIGGGSFSIDSADDAVHSNKAVEIKGGTFNISSGDDGIHADDTLNIFSGEIEVSKSYEGLEATYVTVSGGEIDLTATDDGINAAGGSDSSAVNGRPGQGMFSSGNGKITISGGKVKINASGDGIDANGSLEITGGYTVVTGPTQGDTATLDYDTSAVISGGTFIGTGASGMAQSFSESKNQGVIAVSVGNQSAGTEICLKNSSGKTILTHTPELSFGVAILSSPDINKGETYTLFVGTQSAEFEAN